MNTHTPPAWLNEVTHVMWDLDGTLYPPMRTLEDTIEHRLISRVAEHLGLDYETAHRQYYALHAELKSNTATLTALGIPGAEFFTTLWDQLDWSEFIQPNAELVTALRASRLPHGILTNSNEPRQVARKLSCVGFSPDDFSPIITSTQTGYPKPDPRAFQAVLEALHLPAHHVLYVGDRVIVDILGAIEVGMHAVLVRSEDERAPWCVADPVDVLTTLNDL